MYLAESEREHRTIVWLVWLLVVLILLLQPGRVTERDVDSLAGGTSAVLVVLSKSF